jgi:hypothetical protein
MIRALYDWAIFAARADQIKDSTAVLCDLAAGEYSHSAANSAARDDAVPHKLNGDAFCGDRLTTAVERSHALGLCGQGVGSNMIYHKRLDRKRTITNCGMAGLYQLLPCSSDRWLAVTRYAELCRSCSGGMMAEQKRRTIEPSSEVCNDPQSTMPDTSKPGERASSGVPRIKITQHGEERSARGEEIVEACLF